MTTLFLSDKDLKKIYDGLIKAGRIVGATAEKVGKNLSILANAFGKAYRCKNYKVKKTKIFKHSKKQRGYRRRKYVSKTLQQMRRSYKQTNSLL